MAASTVSFDQQMTEEEYLRGDFESDVDFVEDHIEQRYVGEIEHSNWQGALLAWFRGNYGFPKLYALPEVRTKVADRRYRVPDVSVFAHLPQGRIVTEAPLAIFEILSPEDRYARMKTRFRDYERMGVRNLFAIEGRGEYTHFRDGLFAPVETDRSPLAGSEGFVDWPALAALLL
jgi:Uma2 family endonuclease